MVSKVKACGITEDLETLTQVYTRKGEKFGDISDEAEAILAKLGTILQQNYQRKTIEGNQGIWWITKRKEAGYFVLTDINYSERLAYQLLGELEGKFNEFLENHDLNNLKREGNALIAKYNDPANVDKLSMASHKVNEIKTEVQQNVDKLIVNGDNLLDLEDETKNIRRGAEQFGKKTKALEREMCWQKYKRTCCIVSIIVTVIAIIVIISQL